MFSGTPLSGQTASRVGVENGVKVAGAVGLFVFVGVADGVVVAVAVGGFSVGVGNVPFIGVNEGVLNVLLGEGVT